jgi:hypothetical protein
LKNVIQFFLISAIESALLIGPPVALAVADADGEVLVDAIPVDDGVADVVADAEEETEALGDVVVVVVLLELLDEQAVSAAATARPSTGPTRSRRFV